MREETNTGPPISEGPLVLHEGGFWGVNKSLSTSLEGTEGPSENGPIPSFSAINKWYQGTSKGIGPLDVQKAARSKTFVDCRQPHEAKKVELTNKFLGVSLRFSGFPFFGLQEKLTGNRGTTGFQALLQREATSVGCVSKFCGRPRCLVSIRCSVNLVGFPQFLKSSGMARRSRTACSREDRTRVPFFCSLS